MHFFLLLCLVSINGIMCAADDMYEEANKKLIELISENSILPEFTGQILEEDGRSLQEHGRNLAEIRNHLDTYKSVIDFNYAINLSKLRGSLTALQLRVLMCIAAQP